MVLANWDGMVFIKSEKQRSLYTSGFWLKHRSRAAAVRSQGGSIRCLMTSHRRIYVTAHLICAAWCIIVKTKTIWRHIDPKRSVHDLCSTGSQMRFQYCACVLLSPFPGSQYGVVVKYFTKSGRSIVRKRRKFAPELPASIFAKIVEISTDSSEHVHCFTMHLPRMLRHMQRRR